MGHAGITFPEKAAFTRTIREKEKKKKVNKGEMAV